MNESRSYRRIQDEALGLGMALGQGEETCNLCGDDCRGQESDPSINPFLGALFGAMPSQEEIDQMRREADRNGFLSILAQAQNTLSDAVAASKMIIEIVDDELAGL